MHLENLLKTEKNMSAKVLLQIAIFFGFDFDVYLMRAHYRIHSQKVHAPKLPCPDLRI